MRQDGPWGGTRGVLSLDGGDQEKGASSEPWIPSIWRKDRSTPQRRRGDRNRTFFIFQTKQRVVWEQNPSSLQNPWEVGGGGVDQASKLRDGHVPRPDQSEGSCLPPCYDWPRALHVAQACQ